MYCPSQSAVYRYHKSAASQSPSLSPMYNLTYVLDGNVEMSRKCKGWPGNGTAGPQRICTSASSICPCRRCFSARRSLINLFSPPSPHPSPSPNRRPMPVGPRAKLWFSSENGTLVCVASTPNLLAAGATSAEKQSSFVKIWIPSLAVSAVKNKKLGQAPSCAS